MGFSSTISRPKESLLCPICLLLTHLIASLPPSLWDKNQFSRKQVINGGLSGPLGEGEAGWRWAREVMPWTPVHRAQKLATLPPTFILYFWAINQPSFKPTQVFQFLLLHRAP